jgi:hypothetical protein
MTNDGVLHAKHQVAGTEVWGPALWRAIHFIALGYPSVPSEADAIAYRTFFENLGKVIPCEVCAGNYRRHFEELPIDGFLLGDRGNAYGRVGEDGGVDVGGHTLFDWTVQLHNIVDAELGKAVSDWTSERAKDALFSGRWTTTSTASQQTASGAVGPLPPSVPWQVAAVAIAIIAASLVAIVAAKRSR